MIDCEKKIEDCLSKFDAISLEEIEQQSLFIRYDTKYLLNIKYLDDLLKELKDYYSVLEINGKRCFTYVSLYYDTLKLNFHTNHLNGKKTRLKVRSREYIDYGTCFFELKKRWNKGIIEKLRIQRHNPNGHLEKEEYEFLKNNNIDPNIVKPYIITKYSRITLLSKMSKEKITIDFDLEFLSEFKNYKIDDLVILEIKQENSKPTNFISELLKLNNAVKCSVSKYCLGVITTIPNVKYNQYKKKLLLINKICN